MKRYLRFLGFVAGSIFVMVLLLYTLLPSKGRVSRELAINAAPDVIYHQLVQLRNYESWFPWLVADRNQKVTFSHPSSGNGAYFTWDSKNKNLGSGTFQITAVQPDSMVRFRMLYKNIPEASGQLLIQRDAHHDYSIVMWQIQIDAGWKPWLRLFSLMMDKLVGPALENGLADLKIVSEEASPYVKFRIAETPVPYQYIATESDTITKDRLDDHVRETYVQLKHYITTRHLKQVANPIGQIDTLTDGQLQVNLGIPIDTNADPQGRIRILKMPPGFVLTAHYSGPYRNIGEAYLALSTYASEHAKTSPAPSWEEYMDGHFPMDDSAHRVTIYLPVYR